MWKGRQAAERNSIPGYSTLSDPSRTVTPETAQGGDVREGQSIFLAGSGLPDMARGCLVHAEVVGRWNESEKNGAGVASVHRGARRPRPRAVAASPARQRGRRSRQTTASLTSWFLGNWGEAHNSSAPESPTSLRLGSRAPAASAPPGSCRRCPPNPPRRDSAGFEAGYSPR